MKGVNSLLKEVLSELKPDSARIAREAAATIKRIDSALKRGRISAKAVAGGSVAKGTFLKGDHDCDIFVRFSLKKYRTADISGILEKILKKEFKGVSRVHGSRDYYHIKNQIRYEIVPVLEISSPDRAENITDCSVLHVNWVKKFPKMREEIMLAKAFCKSAGVYGAESYIKGFSGHVVDIITIHHKGFLKLLEAAAKWKHKQVIDYYNAHKGKALFNLNRSKTQSPLIVIDPVQKDRNAAAALGEEKFSIFRKRASEFLRSPSKKFFAVQTLDIEKLRKTAESKKGKLILIDVVPKDGKEDVVGAKLLTALESIAKQLALNEFNVINKGWEWDKSKKALFWLTVDRKNLSETAVRTGPPVKVREHCDNFRKAHKKTFERNGRVCAEVKRDFVNAEKFIKHLLKNKYIRERVKNIRIRDSTRG